MSNYDCKGCKHRTNHTDEGFKFCSGCDRSYIGADSGYHADRYEKEEAETSMKESEAIDKLRQEAKNNRADADWKWRHGRINADGLIQSAENMEQIAKWIEELQQYRAIGTVSELRELKEKATAKSPAYQGEHEKCPTCGSFCIGEYCIKCGQRILFD